MAEANPPTGLTPSGSGAVGVESLANAPRCRLGEATLSFATLEIEVAGERRRVTPKAMAVLLALCRHPGATLSKDQLLDLVWPNDDPTPDVLSQAIRELRRTLGEDSPASSCIQTVPRIGYRLVVEPLPIEPARIATAAALANTPPSTAEEEQNTRGGLGEPAPWPVWLLPLIAVLLLGVIFGGSWLLRTDGSTPAPIPSQANGAPVIELLTSSVLSERQPSLSPDGRWLAYVEFDEQSQQSRIVLSPTNGGERRLLNPTGVARELLPQWSHDGQQLAYQSIEGDHCEIQIARPLDPDASAPRALGSCPSDVYDAVAWAHDDQGLWIARPHADGRSQTPQLVRRDLEGVDHPLDYERNRADWDLDPRPSPDGRWLLFRRGTQPRSDLYLVAVEGGMVRRLTHLDGYFGRAAWHPDSRAIVYSTGSNADRRLYRLDLDSARSSELGIVDADYPDIALGTGDLVFERLRQRLAISELGIDPTAEGNLVPLSRTTFAASTGNNREAVYAPDGRAVAFVSDRSGSEQLWLRRAENEQPLRLSDWPPARLRDLAWSGDGRWLSVIATDAQGVSTALALALSDTPPLSLEQARRLPLPPGEIRHPKLLGNGAQVAWLARGETGWTAWLIDLDKPQASAQALAQLSNLEPALQVEGDSLYLTDPVRGEIIRTDPPYRDARIVASGLPRWVPGRWRLAQGAIWYVWLDQDKRRSLLYRADLPGPLKAEPVLDLSELRAHPVFEISPAADRVLLQHVERDETDIGRWKPPLSREE